MAKDVKVGGHSLSELIVNLEKATDKATAYELAGKYLIDYGNSVGRPGFSYHTSFPKTSPTCVSNFTRKFQHKDWRDGQDLVQAEQTAGEDGFNLRFHQIEGDLDALRDDVKRAFDCLASMRAALFDMLNEVKVELTLINQDLKRLEVCCRESDYPELKQIDDIYAGRYIGPVNWFGKRSLAFQTPHGVTVLPPFGGEDDGPGNPRVKRVAALARILTQDSRITKLFEGDKSVSPAELLKRFGDEEVDGGFTLAETLEILPQNTRYASPQTMLRAVADREAKAIRTTGEAEYVVAAELGGYMTDGSPDTAPVESFEAVPSDSRTALAKAGIGTLAELAHADPKRVTRATGAGPGDVAGWMAAARVITGIG